MPRDLLATVLAAYPVLHQAVRQREVAGPTGQVSTHQATVLAHLAGPVPRTLSDLAAAMGVTLPTMSLLIERLVRGGLVLRERDPGDGRRVMLRLTDAGARAARARSVVDPDRVRALLASLTPAERAVGVQGLTTLARAAERLAVPGSAHDRE